MNIPPAATICHPCFAVTALVEGTVRRRAAVRVIAEVSPSWVISAVVLPKNLLPPPHCQSELLPRESAGRVRIIGEANNAGSIKESNKLFLYLIIRFGSFISWQFFFPMVAMQQWKAYKTAGKERT